MSLVFTHMTACQVLHRTARPKRGETVLVHGAAGRVGTAVLELGAVAGLHMYGTCSGRDRAAVERLGAVAIDYRTEDFLARVHELPGKGVDDGLGGRTSLRSFRALRPGGRFVWGNWPDASSCAGDLRASANLTARKRLPTLGRLAADGALAPEVTLVGWRAPR